MSESSGPWDIGDLADLLLGQGAGGDADSVTPKTNPVVESASSETDEDGDATYISVLILVNPIQDPVESVSRYADYWSNRGQTVSVAWLGDSGIKIGLFDPLRRTNWSAKFINTLQEGHYEDIPRLVKKHVRRLVFTIVAKPGWEHQQVVSRASSACVLVEPTSAHLIRSYETLKLLAQTCDACELSCFVMNASSAVEATQLSTRLQSMGDRFLEQEINFEGFSLDEPWPSSNIVGETFISNDGEAGYDSLKQVLLSCFNTPKIPSHKTARNKSRQENHDDHVSVETDQPCRHSNEINTEPASEKNEENPKTEQPVRSRLQPANCDAQAVQQMSMPQVRGAVALPRARLVACDASIDSAAQLDKFAAGILHDLYDDVEDSFPVHTSPTNGMCFRWVRRKNGARSIVISTVGAPRGAIEHASAQLYPLEEQDEIVVFAGNLSTDQRKAAQALRSNIRLMEVASLDSDEMHGLVLKDVTHAIG